MKRIGVFICHCGINIAGTVDVNRVKEEISKYPGVAHCEDYKYMCSDPGQLMIKDAVKEKNLEGVIVAACSPTLHEVTFRRAVQSVGMNPYLYESANIREQCSWVHSDKAKATEKAIKIIQAMVEKVHLNEALVPVEVGVTRRALVIGAGIAGMQAALDIANGGYEVVLVEKDPSIGGHMAQLSETFPTLDCSQCIMTPKMVEVGQHEKIKLLTYSEIEEVSGYVGNFKVKVKKKPRYVDMAKCTACGECMIACPVLNEPQLQPVPEYSKKIESERLQALDKILLKYAPVNPRYLDKRMLIQVLQDINLEHNYLPDYALKYVSQRLKVPLSQVYHIATFYTVFSLKPRGKHLVRICMGTACYARGAPRILEEFERQLEIHPGETTPDLQFTLEKVNCLGCCALGPVVTVDQDYHSVSASKVKSLLKKYRNAKD